MDIPRFEQRNVNPRLAGTDIGDSFQGFVHELLLPERPQLHRFPGGGKDGGIDLIETSGTCFVVECKVVGEDDYVQIKKRWKTVRGHLEKHLCDPNRPTNRQSQYKPWYDTNAPIAEYVFCVSATFGNDNQRRDFKTRIAGFFHNLAKQRSHLYHLAALEVTVIDWNDLCDRLRKRPHMVFRWFPKLRPNGLVPLDESLDVGTFRAYLNSGTLPYYSVAEHLYIAPPPNNITILDEESLLARLEDQTITGLVISGKGGIGKSRLTLELGWKARRKGWTVMRAQSRLKSDALEKLVERLSPETPVLLLVDYIETQSDFLELVENLNLLNDTGVARIRYVAACRTGYYHQAVEATGRHLPVDLSPPPGDAAVDWFREYRCESVQRILAKAGIAVTTDHLAVCHDLPILAVFMAYLHTSGRTEELAELLNEVEFGRWVARRVQLSFPASNVSRALALLVPLFPMTDAAVAKLRSPQLHPVFERLATDGWIERATLAASPSFGEWMTAHDVLADQILSAYLRGIPNTAETFVAELLSLATELECLDSALIALQRIADAPPLNAVSWTTVIANAIEANENAWRNVRSLLIRTTLLAVPDRIALLNRHKDLWGDAAQEVEFHNALGWFCRWLSIADAGIDTASLKVELIPWILKAASFADKSNFVITWGLRLSPETLREIALHWISNRPGLFQTHYLMVAWLECGLPPQAIALSIQSWCRKFSKTPHLSFVAEAWLNVKGDKEIVRDAIKEWLDEHKTTPQANFVYRAWLDIEGDKELVGEAIKKWLDAHTNKTDAEGRYVYKSWLDAGGDKELVQDAIKVWLAVHKTDAKAQFVYNAWLDAGGDKALVEQPIRDWLSIHKTAAEAQFIYNAWLDAKGNPELIRDAIGAWLDIHKTDANVSSDASHVYKAWLDAGGDKALVEQPIKDWLVVHKTNPVAKFVYNSWLDAGGERDVVWDSLLLWLAEYRTNESAVRITKFVAKQPDLPDASVKDVLVWCRTFAANEDALWRVTQLGPKLLNVDVLEDACATAETILFHITGSTNEINELTSGQVATLLNYLVEAAHFHSSKMRDRVDVLIVVWMRHPNSFGRRPKPHTNIQRVRFTSRVLLLLHSGELDFTRDREPIRRFLEWLDEWDMVWKQRLRSTIEVYSTRYPAPEVWGIVRFEEHEV